MSTNSNDYRIRYSQAVEAPVDESEEHLREHREEHTDSWEVKRSPELLMHMYHDQLNHYDSKLADELVDASESKVNYKDATWLTKENDQQQNNYPMGYKSETIFYASAESLKYVTHGDREQAAIILGYSMTKPVDDAVEQVQDPVVRERLESQLKYIENRFRVSFTYNDIQRYHDNVDHLQSIVREVELIEERQAHFDEASYKPEPEQEKINEYALAASIHDQRKQEEFNAGHGPSDQEQDNADFDQGNSQESHRMQEQTEHPDPQPVNNPASNTGDEPTSYPDGYSSRRAPADLQDSPQQP